MMQGIRRMKRNPMLPTETLEHELYRLRRQEQYISLVALGQPFARAITHLSAGIDAITPVQCDEIGMVLQLTQRVVQAGITALGAPDLALETCPYSLLLRFCSLHRMIVDTQVLVRNVRGLCEVGHLFAGHHPVLCVKESCSKRSF